MEKNGAGIREKKHQIAPCWELALEKATDLSQDNLLSDELTYGENKNAHYLHVNNTFFFDFKWVTRCLQQLDKF
jgi:hypothetical protein